MCLQIHEENEDHEGNISSVMCSQESMQLASALRNVTTKVWDANLKILHITNCECLELERDSTYERYHSLRPVAYPRSLTWMVCGKSNEAIEIVGSESYGLPKTLEGHHGSVELVVLSHDSTRLASASQDKTVRVWDVSRGTCLPTLEGYSCDSISLIVFSCDLMLPALGLVIQWSRQDLRH